MTAPSGEVRELAAAIREALAVPVADSRRPGARLAEKVLMLERAAHVRGALAALADGEGSISATAETIRESTAETPVTYAVYQRAEVAS